LNDGFFFKAVMVFIILLIALLLTTPFMVLFSSVVFIEEEFISDFTWAFLLSLFSSLLSASISVMLVLPVSYYTSRFLRGWRRRIVYSLLMVTAVITPSATGVLLLEFFTLNPLGGYLNRVFGVVGDVEGVVVAQLFVSIPIAFSYYAALFASVSRVYEELALESGLTRIGYLYRVLLPMLRGRVLAGYVLVFSRAFSDFGASLILGGGIRGRTWTLPILVYSATYMGGLVTVSTVLAFYLVFAVLLYYFLSGLEERGVGGVEEVE